MGKILGNYTNYTKHVPEYLRWNEEQNKQQKVANISDANLKAKAKTIAEPILLFDKYERERAEDSETFFQTLNIELMSVTGLISSLPIAVSKALPFLNKHADKNTGIKKTAELLTKYTNKTLKLGNKTVPLPKALTLLSTAAAALFFVKGMKGSIFSQQGIIRKAGFDASKNIINDPALFAQLTPEQEKQVEKIVSAEKKNNINFVDKIKDKININSSFQAVEEYRKNLPDYKKKKQAYFEEQKRLEEKNTRALSSDEVRQSKEDKEVFNGLIKNIEHDVLIPLERVEKVSNIAYSSLFMGGFLEYLISDKLVNVLKIQNKPIRAAAKLGIPILTYLLLNKNISDIENKAILATKYKHLKKFIEDPTGKQTVDNNKKETLPKFLKGILNDMREYNNFAQTELPEIEARLNAKRELKLSEKQLKDAKLLQENTSMVLNNHREHLYNQTVGIETLSETVLAPVDILFTAIGGFIGNKLAKANGNKKLTGLYTGLGAIIGFIPTAIAEIVFTKEQKKAEKIAAMLSIKDLQDYRKFADKNKKEINYIEQDETSTIFNEIKKAQLLKKK